MKNKLPVVGKRYRDKSANSFFTTELVQINNGECVLKGKFAEDTITSRCHISEFFDYFEELYEEKEEPKKFTVNFSQDGNKICATLDDFIDLQESPVGFGDNKEEALVGLVFALKKELKDRASPKYVELLEEQVKEMTEAFEKVEKAYFNWKKGIQITEIFTPEVREGIEELRKEFNVLGEKTCQINSDYQDYFKKSQKLLNALNNQEEAFQEQKKDIFKK